MIEPCKVQIEGMPIGDYCIVCSHPLAAHNKYRYCSVCSFEHLAVARVKPGDVIVYTPPRRLSVDDSVRVQSMLSEIWPRNKVVILHSGDKLEIVRPTKENGQDETPDAPKPKHEPETPYWDAYWQEERDVATHQGTDGQAAGQGAGEDRQAGSGH
jgi:hypothetical protein